MRVCAVCCAGRGSAAKSWVSPFPFPSGSPWWFGHSVSAAAAGHNTPPRVSLAILNTDIGTIFGDSTYWCLRSYESVYKQLISHIRNLLNVCLKQRCLYVDIGTLSVNPLFDLFNVFNCVNIIPAPKGSRYFFLGNILPRQSTSLGRLATSNPAIQLMSKLRDSQPHIFMV